jgi:hypothetical protein
MSINLHPQNSNFVLANSIFLDETDNRLKFKNFNGEISSFVLSAPMPSSNSTVPTSPASGVSLVITDDSGADGDIYFSIIGLQNDQWAVNPLIRQWSYMDANGNAQVCQSGQDFSQYFHKMENKMYSGTLPYFFSGRITFSLGQPPQYFPVLTPSGLPMPSQTDTSDPWWNVINDKLEFTNKLQSLGADITTLNANTTLVDGFAIPLALSISGGVFGYQAAGSLAVSRDEAFDQFEKMSKDYTEQIVINSGTYVRVLSPKTAISRVSGTGPMFPSNIMESYIDSVWDFFSQPGNYFLVTLDAYAGFPTGVTTSGNVVGGVLTFPDPLKQTTFTIDKPGSEDLLGCQGVFNVTNLVNGTWDGNIKVAVAGAMNRGVAVNQHVCNVNNFYTGTNHNQYAKTVHEISVNQVNYAFPYDDACNLYSSDLSDNQPSFMHVTLQSWKKEKA